MSHIIILIVIINLYIFLPQGDIDEDTIVEKVQTVGKKMCWKTKQTSKNLKEVKSC